MSFTQITCPVCLTPLSESDNICPEQGCCFKLPQNYYQNCREAPPLPIAAVGYSGHGKTHLLATIVLTLRELARRPMKDLITFEVLDERTKNMMEDWSKHEKSQDTLEETAESPNRPQPMILRVSGIFPDRTLLVYDVAGQVFHNLAPGGDLLRILRDIHTVWFVVSPHDLTEGVAEAREADQKYVPTDLSYLFSSYRTTMGDLKVELEGRHAIMVMTKGDKLTGGKARPLHDYLDSDPFRPDASEWPDLSIKDYEQNLRQTSALVQSYTEGIGDVRSIVSLLGRARMEVSFCVTSALGQDPSPGIYQKTLTPWLRQRVLDPLIWTLLLEKNRAAAQAHVIIDPGIGTTTGYPACTEGPLPALLWKGFPRHQHVQAWFLGQSAPAASPGQPPPAAPQRLPRLRLIGALLEPLANVAHPEGRVVLITNSVVTDLEDFKSGAWSSRLLLITSSDSAAVREQWPNTKIIGSRDDLNDVLEFLNP